MLHKPLPDVPLLSRQRVEDEDHGRLEQLVVGQNLAALLRVVVYLNRRGKCVSGGMKNLLTGPGLELVVAQDLAALFRTVVIHLR